jgi:hypothetical protein
MDFIFGLLEKLATSLSPTMFLAVIALLVMSVFMTIKMMTKNIGKKKNSILALVTGQASAQADPDHNADIKDKLDTLFTTVNTLTPHGESELHLEQILFAISEIKTVLLANDGHFEKHLIEILAMKKDLEAHNKSINDELSDIKHQMKMHELQNHQEAEIAKELQQRMHGILVRMISQVEKIDEFLRNTVPEFRSYSKDLTKDISDLSKDIALVERTIQTQINSNVKLR